LRRTVQRLDEHAFGRGQAWCLAVTDGDHAGLGLVRRAQAPSQAAAHGLGLWAGKTRFDAGHTEGQGQQRCQLGSDQRGRGLHGQQRVVGQVAHVAWTHVEARWAG
jgi:hypothetical protein